MIYMLPLGLGVSKAKTGHSWGTPYDSFWCCYGTGDIFFCLFTFQIASNCTIFFANSSILLSALCSQLPFLFPVHQELSHSQSWEILSILKRKGKILLFTSFSTYQAHLIGHLGKSCSIRQLFQLLHGTLTYEWHLLSLLTRYLLHCLMVSHLATYILDTF